MIASLPGLYTEISPATREALLCALRYYHNPKKSRHRRPALLGAVRVNA
jgi:hypothetical protein